jgi:D-alanyl-D-alanine dipeptidase
VGDIIDGYHANRAILTRFAAEALAKAQKQFRNDGYCIVIYDAFRPQKSVDHFFQWSQALEDQSKKSQYYPYVDKNRAFELGYIAHKSGHSRGSTIDLTIISTDKCYAESPAESQRSLSHSPTRTLPFLDDNTVDMGSSFDLFDEASHHGSHLVDANHRKNREYLKLVMENCGFRAYDQEWWHYTFENEPYPDTYFDFDIA